MPQQGRSGLGWLDGVERGLVSADSELPNLRAANLQDPRASRIWRAATDTTTLRFDLVNQRFVGLVGLIGLNAHGGSLTTRVRLSLDSPTMASGVVFDSGSLTGQVDPAFPDLWHATPGSDVTCRYGQIDLSDATVERLEAVRLVAMRYFRPARAYALATTEDVEDPSVTSLARSGEEWTDELPRKRVWTVAFPSVTEGEMAAEVRSLTLYTGKSKDLAVVRDAQAVPLGLQVLLGLPRQTLRAARQFRDRWSVGDVTVAERTA